MQTASEVDPIIGSDEIAVPAPEEGMRIFGGGVRSVEAHNFDLDDADQEDSYLAAACGATEHLQTAVGKTLDVVHFVSRPANGTDKKTGQAIQGIRSVIVTADGKRYSTWSPNAVRLFASIERTKRGGKRYDPPLRVEIAQQPNGTGGNFLTLTPLPSSRGNSKPPTGGKGK